MAQTEKSHVGKFFTQSTHYLYSHVLIMISQIISFPVLTRNLSVADYGKLGLFTVTVFFVAAFCKSGIQNSFIRFYDEYKYKKKRADIYYSTFFFGPLAVTVVIVILFWLITGVFFRKQIITELADVLPFLIFMILFKSVYIIFMSFWRAEQRTKIFNNLLVFTAYSTIVLGIGFLFLVQKDIYGLLSGQLLAEIISAVLIVSMILKNYGKEIKISSFSLLLFKEAMLFGLPLLGMEFTNLLLSAGDRFVIATFMNEQALGLYTAAGNLVNSVSGCLVFPISFAIVPIFMNIWITKGKEQTQEFLSNVTSYYFLIALPIIFGIIAAGEDLIVFFASEKYISSNSVIPFLVSGTILFGSTNIFNAGLLLKKKTSSLMFLTMLSGLVNIILNVVFIKMGMGIIGSALATLISYVLLIFLTIIIAFKYLSFKIDIKQISQYLVISLLMFLSVNFIKFKNPLLDLVIKMSLGGTVYVSLVLIFNAKIRKLLREKLLNRFKKPGDVV